MKKTYIILAAFISVFFSFAAHGQSGIKTKGDDQTEEKARQYVAALTLTDTVKAARVTAVIVTHLEAVHAWHNSHPYTLTPEGINPKTGSVFTKLERQLIIDSTIPKTVHQELMTGLREYLTADQVNVILDKYTIGKVAFTMRGYKAIIPDMTPAEETTILTNLELAREQAVDYKETKEMSVIFKIYKTKIEDYLDNHGRNWRVLYKTYADKVLAQKAAAKKEKGGK